MGYAVFRPSEVDFADRGDGSGRLFVVLDGTGTMLLGDPPERVDLPHGSVCAVGPGTPLQIRNDGDADLLLLIVGAPPVESGADYFPDVP